MPYCPDCRYEYRAGIPECPDCNAGLVDRLPANGHQPLRLVEVHRGRSPEVQILESALRHEGIPCLVRPVEPLAALVGDVALSMYSQLLVSAEHYEEFRDRIED